MRGKITQDTLHSNLLPYVTAFLTHNIDDSYLPVKYCSRVPPINLNL